MLFRDEVLYILTAEHNATGLSRAHAEELTRAIMQALHVRLPEALRAAERSYTSDLLRHLGDERA